MASDYLTECKKLKSVSKGGKDPCFFIEANDGLLSQFQPPQPFLAKKQKTFAAEGGATGGPSNTLAPRNDGDKGSGSGFTPWSGGGGGSSGGVFN